MKTKEEIYDIVSDILNKKGVVPYDLFLSDDLFEFSKFLEDYFSYKSEPRIAAEDTRIKDCKFHEDIVYIFLKYYNLEIFDSDIYFHVDIVSKYLTSDFCPSMAYQNFIKEAKKYIDF